jgi:hypothetical protein
VPALCPENFVGVPVGDELGAGLLQCELVYPRVNRSEDEHCCFPIPGISPSSSNLLAEHTSVQYLGPCQAASGMMEMCEPLEHTVEVH